MKVSITGSQYVIGMLKPSNSTSALKSFYINFTALIKFGAILKIRYSFIKQLIYSTHPSG